MKKLILRQILRFAPDDRRHNLAGPLEYIEPRNMELDKAKIDDAVLALLLLGASGHRAWKGFDWEALERLHENGFISNPRTKDMSIVFTDEGLSRAKRLLQELFGSDA